MIMKGPLTAALVAAAGLGLTASAFGQLPEKKLGPDMIHLNGQTTWTLGKLTLAPNTVLVTNGHPLTIVVAGDLVIEGTATIMSFSQAERAANKHVPHKAGKGADGVSHNRGPGSEGTGVNGNRGADGGPGSPGAAGANGNRGRDASSITIVVTGSASGNLRVINTGMDGQPGGDGGDGGRGGNGQQGGRGVPNYVLGVALGALKGPGGGGTGGHGGQGGPGGRGGDAGNGGTLTLKLLDNKSRLSVETDLRGGSPSPGGKGGAGGGGGEFGWGGRGNAGVHGRVEERKGAPGQPGRGGPNGPGGNAGADGRYEGNVVKPIK